MFAAIVRERAKRWKILFAFRFSLGCLSFVSHWTPPTAAPLSTFRTDHLRFSISLLFPCRLRFRHSNGIWQMTYIDCCLRATFFPYYRTNYWRHKKWLRRNWGDEKRISSLFFSSAAAISKWSLFFIGADLLESLRLRPTTVEALNLPWRNATSSSSRRSWSSTTTSTEQREYDDEKKN